MKTSIRSFGHRRSPPLLHILLSAAQAQSSVEQRKAAHKTANIIPCKQFSPQSAVFCQHKNPGQIDANISASNTWSKRETCFINESVTCPCVNSRDCACLGCPLSFLCLYQRPSKQRMAMFFFLLFFVLFFYSFFLSSSVQLHTAMHRSLG
jgi:hypothetical protein